MSKYYLLAALLGICGWINAATTPSVTDMLADEQQLLRILVGGEAKNMCLIDPEQLCNASDLLGRLVVLSGHPNVPADTLRFSFRVNGTKVTTSFTKENIVYSNTVAGGDSTSLGLLNWIGASMAKDDIAEVKITRVPGVSMSVDDLDEARIASTFQNTDKATRDSLGIIVGVVPYEAYASVCKQVKNTRDVGIWYIRYNKTWYSKTTSDAKRNYLVAVITPISFLNDIGVINGERMSIKSIENPAPLTKALKTWTKKNKVNVEKPTKERHIDLKQ
jgi:hypothetical protein